ncbi:unnamed protein product [Didymodactylos carnosus]|uniref:SecA DEAD-like N-terminal domain-containing protein n=1 Tax=Didymodactylos carnosus TaxID=1234261 RepID=A0A814BGJ1_9BILA|nr:unnamed protein product [Didymodactylos carnosus]CAF3705694.1 unnamed protein product [Didymodactylos carnosus]
MDRKNNQTEKFHQTFSNIIYYLYALNSKNELLKIFKEKAHFKIDEILNIISKFYSDKSTAIKNELNELKLFLKQVKEFSDRNLTIDDIKKWLIEFNKLENIEEKQKCLPKLLAVIEQGTKIYYSEIKSLRHVQKLTIFAFNFNKKKLLSQVSTGEGKSLIVATIMIIKCLLGEKGDIITSSSDLAERYANDNEKL